MYTLRERLTTEDTIENDAVVKVRRLRGTSIKLRFMRGWPDRMFLLPGGVIFFVEFKRPVGGKFEPLQEYKHAVLQRLGFRVYVCLTKQQFASALGEMMK